MQFIINKKTLTLLGCMAVMQLGYVYADLNDTGAVKVDVGAPDGQDAQIGRDAAAAAGMLPKTGSGSKGFDFTKIANDGSELSYDGKLEEEGGQWVCTRDNVTGLTWEVKTDDDGLRDKDWTYSWYSTDYTSNGGVSGKANGGECYDSDNCDTEKFTDMVNSVALCGYTDWRMPTLEELLSIVDYGKYPGPAIDADFFPNTVVSSYWSASVWADFPSVVWLVYFGSGDLSGGGEFSTKRVRLVRGGQ